MQTVLTPSTTITLPANATHAPRTGYNAAMWQAVQAVPGIQKGVTFSTLHAALLKAVPGQAPHHCTAHIKYLVRQKGGLQVAQPKAVSK